jgi:phosphopantothenoylcysteine decarboxylase / phosphopantothenate---cysteine ligase
MKRHPSHDITSSIGIELAGKRVALCLTGSVAVIRSVDLARLLIRHGAEVYPVMSQAAAGLIGPDMLEWATGFRPVTEITGAIEHVALAGNVDHPVDLIVVAPATANTIGKIASGIDDTPVTTVVTTAIGQQIPVLVVPAMHEPMYRHQIVLDNLEKLKRYGIDVMDPVLSEGKAKLPDTDTIYARIVAILDRKRREGALAGKRVLITAGRTVEYLDPIRVFTNNSTGKMGMAIASAAVSLGALVTVVYGKGTAAAPPGVTVVNVDTSDDMLGAVNSCLDSSNQDVMIAAAAVGDWKPREKASSKITTHGSEGFAVELVPTAKIIDTVKKRHPEVFLVAFRALHDLSQDALIENAYARMNKAGADLIAVNDVSKSGAGFGTDTNEVFVVDRAKNTHHISLRPKAEVARQLMDIVTDAVCRTPSTEE